LNPRPPPTSTTAVPGLPSPGTAFVRPFVGRAGDLLTKYLGTLRWGRDEVFITNVVKCRPPDNRDPEPDEIAACAPYLQRQLEVLDPALIVTLGRHSLGRFMPGERISQAHGTVHPIDPASGAPNALGFALYHPAAALRSTEVERQSYADVALIPAALVESRSRREHGAEPAVAAGVGAAILADVTPEAMPAQIPDVTTDVTLF